MGFLIGKEDKPFIEEAALYFEARGLSIKAMGVEMFSLTPTPWYLDKKGEVPFIAKGWAMKVRTFEGEWHPRQQLLRVCNVKGKVYGRDGEEVEVPKFLQINKSKDGLLHHVGSIDLFRDSKTLAIHEKITSAELFYRETNIPSVAVSGCWGWSRKRKLMAELEWLLEVGLYDRLLVMFDGDIESKPSVMQAASTLKTLIKTHNGNTEVDVLMIPDVKGVIENGRYVVGGGAVGWDDYIVAVGGEELRKWLDDAKGIEVYSRIPPEWLMRKYLVSVVDGKNGVRVEHTEDNYLRLLRVGDWSTFKVDYGGDVYCNGEYYGSMELFVSEYTRWLERCIFRGHAGGVVKGKVKDALRTWVGENRVSIVNELLGKEENGVGGVEEARKVAERLLVDGFGYVGPLEMEEMVETVLRMFRDMVKIWNCSVGDNGGQWVWSIIGPSGCGKSSSPAFMMAGLKGLGLRKVPIAYFDKSHRIDAEKECRKGRDCLVHGVDDYNPEHSYARDVENYIYEHVGNREAVINEKYVEGMSEVWKRGWYFLTTTDKTKDFIRSEEGTGERRFIPMEIKGVERGRDGRMRVNKEVLEECGLQLLVWAEKCRGRGGEGEGEVVGDTTEYSEKVVGEYIRSAGYLEASGLGGVSSEWVREWLQPYYRESTYDYRFNIYGTFCDAIGDGKMRPHIRKSVVKYFESIGAENIRRARVNRVERGKVTGQTTPKTVHCVVDINKFIAAWCP